jgi:hypothetical protein
LEDQITIIPSIPAVVNKDWDDTGRNIL